jgi:hypothetical protein
MGRDHAIKRRNCQDACRAGIVEASAFGIVSDGCGQGSGSELGAQLSSLAAEGAIRRALAEGAPLEDLPLRVERSVLRSLGAVAAAAPKEVVGAWAVEHLCATLLFFVVREGRAIVVAWGDGLALVDDEAHVFDEDNRPSYLAYDLLGGRPSVRVVELETPRRVAVATDGLDADILRRVVASPRADLSRALRVAQNEGALEDDGAVALVELLDDVAVGS